MLFMKCLIGGIIIVLMIIQFTFTVLEQISMTSQHSNFQYHSLEKKGWGSYINWKSDYPYNVVEGKYLCKDKKALTAKRLVCPFDNAEQIKEDFANHSEKWDFFYVLIRVNIFHSENCPKCSAREIKYRL